MRLATVPTSMASERSHNEVGPWHTPRCSARYGHLKRLEERGRLSRLDKRYLIPKLLT